MPNILKLDGLIVVIFLNDHRPAHVHVIGNGCESVFKLHCPAGPPELRENYRFKERELNRIHAALIENLAHLCREWRRFHGTY